MKSLHEVETRVTAHTEMQDLLARADSLLREWDEPPNMGTIVAPKQLIRDLAAALRSSLSVQSEEERLVEAPERLVLLADWVDAKYPHDSDPQVQRDLREWAATIRALLDAQKKADGR